MATQKTINKYHDIMERGLFTEREIISFRSLLRENGEEADALLDKFNRLSPFKLTNEQQKKGLDWLCKSFLRKDGSVRETKEVEDVRLQAGFRLEKIIDAIKHAKETDAYEFMLIDLMPNPDVGIFALPEFHPVYELASGNNSFAYSYIQGHLYIIKLNQLIST